MVVLPASSACFTSGQVIISKSTTAADFGCAWPDMTAAASMQTLVAQRRVILYPPAIPDGLKSEYHRPRIADCERDAPTGTSQSVSYRAAPGPISTFPGRSAVTFPSCSTSFPFTITSLTPTEYWCGRSYVARSPTVAG